MKRLASRFAGFKKDTGSGGDELDLDLGGDGTGRQLMHVQLVEGCNLPSKHSSGLCDPLCRMYISTVGADAFQEGVRVDEKLTRRVSSRMLKSTINPVWNQVNKPTHPSHRCKSATSQFRVLRTHIPATRFRVSPFQ